MSEIKIENLEKENIEKPSNDFDVKIHPLQEFTIEDANFTFNDVMEKNGLHMDIETQEVIEKEVVSPNRLDIEDFEESGLSPKEYCENQYRDYLSWIDDESEQPISYEEFYDRMKDDYEYNWEPSTIQWALNEMNEYGMDIDEYCNAMGYNYEDIMTEPKEW